MNFHVKPDASGLTDTRGLPVRFEALDSWRGIAALLVVLFHAQIVSHVHGWPLVRSGEALVDFFFVLSGFVIAHAYVDRIGDGRRFGKFLVLRLGRIYPLHLFMFALFLLFEIAKSGIPGLTNPADPAFSGSNAPWTMVSNLLLLHALQFNDVLSWNTPSWSISAEWLCYIFFGLAALHQRRRLAWLLCATVVAAPLAIMAFAPAGMNTTADLGALRALFSFALGALLYVLAGGLIVRNHRADVSSSGVSLGKSGSWTVVEAAVVAIAALMVVHAHETAFAYLRPLAFCALIAVFAIERGLVSRLMKMRELLFLGLISYSIYMTHMFVQLRLTNLARLSDTIFGTHSVIQLGRTAQYGGAIDTGSLLSGDALMALMLAITIGVSWLTYRWIERPGMKASRKLAERLFP